MQYPYLDKGLATLRTQIKKSYPGTTVYWIGDDNHQKAKSDHNAEADGSVDAIDIMLGPTFSKAQAETVVETLRDFRDSRIAYVIFNRRIFSSTIDPWKWRTYSGSNTHTDHIHVSANDIHENDTTPWKGFPSPMPNARLLTINGEYPELKQGMTDPCIRGISTFWIHRLQDLLNLQEDGIYGPKTAEAVKKYNKTRIKRDVDGRTVDATTWIWLLGIYDGHQVSVRPM